jgi:hypothetical protein
VESHQKPVTIVESKIEEIEGNNYAQTESESTEQVARLTPRGQHVRHLQQRRAALRIKF